MIDTKAILEYKKIIQTTNLQRGYQEQNKLFRSLRTYLAKSFDQFDFSGNIVENNMDYAYFQFTDEKLKSKGLKIVIAFIYKDFEYEVWLSGYNRKIQTEYHKRFKDMKWELSLSPDPNRNDYILKQRITKDVDYGDIDQLFDGIQASTRGFINTIEQKL